METVILNMLHQVSGQGLPIVLVALVVGVYAGMKLAVIRTKSMEIELDRKQKEIEYLSEENRKLREDVRSTYKSDIRDNLRSD